MCTFLRVWPSNKPHRGALLLLIDRLIVERWEFHFTFFFFRFSIFVPILSIFSYLEYIALYQISYRPLTVPPLLDLDSETQNVSGIGPVMGIWNRLIMAPWKFIQFTYSMHHLSPVLTTAGAFATFSLYDYDVGVGSCRPRKELSGFQAATKQVIYLWYR